MLIFFFSDINILLLGRCSCGPMDEQETVTEMDYCSCNLEEIPVDVKDYKNSLVKLSLESNTITELTQVGETLKS